ncbi:MAG: multicopper oxidase domain-containing protein [Methanomicrobiales archaeon]|nr:multicopper oxidase domain-containing protein [Methanomicrobiales archaeon]
MNIHSRWKLLFAALLVICLFQTASAALHAPSGKVVHYELYVTDGYVNTAAGVFPAVGDNTLIAGWPKPLYVWGFTDIDPNIPANLMTVPAGALAPKGGRVGNAKFPAPFIEAAEGDDIYITVHNRGFYQARQAVQDDHSLHLHGIHAQAQYDGFPESAGNFSEQMRYFWNETWYLGLGTTTKARDAAWNALPVGNAATAGTQQWYLAQNAPLMKTNNLNPAGGITSQFNLAPYPLGVGAPLPAGVTRESATQFTYYFRAEHPGTYMYHCHVAAAEHVQMGMYGALIIRPRTGGTGAVIFNQIYGDNALSAANAPTQSDVFTAGKEYTFLLSEIDPNWHAIIEQGKRKAFYPPNWKPELWFVNGRTFPETIFNFAWNAPAGATNLADYRDPRYNTYINIQSGDIFLIRYINMGYQEHPMHQHGWHFKVMGTDARPLTNSYQKYTILIGSGETYDVLVTADPTYGVTDPQGPRLGTDPGPGLLLNPVTPGATNFRQIFPIHDHDDYRVTTNGIYPGGALVLMEATGIPGTDPATPTWADPYVAPPGIQTVPPPPA